MKSQFCGTLLKCGIPHLCFKVHHLLDFSKVMRNIHWYTTFAWSLVKLTSGHVRLNKNYNTHNKFKFCWHESWYQLRRKNKVHAELFWARVLGPLTCWPKTHAVASWSANLSLSWEGLASPTMKQGSSVYFRHYPHSHPLPEDCLKTA